MGAFYSPVDLVEPMVRWAIRRTTDLVLDPSCGDGVFLQTAARHLLTKGARPNHVARCLVGIDLNPDAIAVTSLSLKRDLGSRSIQVREQDFFSLVPHGLHRDVSAGVDAVIGNPPYIRYQEFSGETRSRALECSLAAGVTLPALTSSWAPFVVHAATFLKPGGRLAFILPAELVHAAYAAPVRRYLRNHFVTVVLISFRRPVFPGVQERVVVLLAEGYGPTAAGQLVLVQVEETRDLDQLDELLSRGAVYEAESEPEKWLPGFDEGPEVELLDRLRDERCFVPLREIGKAGIGFVSGANDFFVLASDEAGRRKLPEESLRPCVIRAKQIPGLRLTTVDWEGLRDQGERCLLWLPSRRLKRAEMQYVNLGESIGLRQRYKCRNRKPWYLVPGVEVPHAFLTYMSGDIPRMCLNEANVCATNNLLSVRLHRVPAELRSAFVVAFHNSATLLSAERTGRSYGGGVLKLEPTEADRILVPSVESVEKFRVPLMGLADTLDRGLRNGRNGALRSAIAAVDKVLFDSSTGSHSGRSRIFAKARERHSEGRRLAARP